MSRTVPSSVIPTTRGAAAHSASASARTLTASAESTPARASSTGNAACASRASSSKRWLLTVVPKNSVAASSRPCASSKMTAS